MNDRIKAIEAMLRDKPQDVFLHYSLGMELATAGDLDRAVESFRTCMALDSGYIPAYVESGKTLRTMGRLGQARDTFAAALQLAGVQGERHMQDYIRQQLEGLPQ